MPSLTRASNLEGRDHVISRVYSPEKFKKIWKNWDYGGIVPGLNRNQNDINSNEKTGIIGLISRCQDSQFLYFSEFFWTVNYRNHMVIVLLLVNLHKWLNHLISPTYGALVRLKFTSCTIRTRGSFGGYIRSLNLHVYWINIL